MSLAWANPVEHAMVLIDACGDVDAAFSIACANWENANSANQVRYWFSVAQALIPPAVSA